MNQTTKNRDLEAMFTAFKEKSASYLKNYKFLFSLNNIDVGTAEKELCFQSDKTALYHYSPLSDSPQKVPTLVVYALVNRPYMLDLQPDRSLVRNLLSHGVDLYMIDWGYPDRSDQYLTMDDYINGYLDDCVDYVKRRTGHHKVNLIGICQGGTFATIYTALNPTKVKNLVTMVTPIDFSSDEALLFKWSRFIDVDTMVDALGIIPADFLNLGFMMVRPFDRLLKYVNFLENLDQKEKTLNFLRMEKWIFDSPGQAGECYRQFIKDLYQENKLVQDRLDIGGKQVHLSQISMPVLNIYARYDHIVPPAATIALQKHITSKDTELYEFEGGHIGLFVSSKTQKEVGPAVAQWLRQRDR
ncbi:class III poly(R)-hydroxyalkanoic acid synthase subunit PhaC [candidate division CSSED10-310 bacterium]|uniref:Poly(3-hydroxyalkanoate) polymerase subunit PhaC n=1 Tax=candidate division CSSED10-310 bacterium TaxID=2855610 RepID=A0ABV6Z1J0_UNCC1